MSVICVDVLASGKDIQTSASRIAWPQPLPIHGWYCPPKYYFQYGPAIESDTKLKTEVQLLVIFDYSCRGSIILGDTQTDLPEPWHERWMKTWLLAGIQTLAQQTRGRNVTNQAKMINFGPSGVLSACICCITSHLINYSQLKCRLGLECLYVMMPSVTIEQPLCHVLVKNSTLHNS